MVYCAQLGQHPLVRTTETSSERSSGQLSCLIARPPDEISLTRHEHGPGWSPCSPEHCPVCRLQARGVGACPEVALSTIERFVRLLSGPRPTSRAPWRGTTGPAAEQTEPFVLRYRFSY